MRRMGSFFLFVSLFAGSVAAQHVVDPGMSKAQVVARLGKPAVERSAGTSTYLFYSNGMRRTVGMNDIVVLDSDKVVDAIFRSRARTLPSRRPKPARPSVISRRPRPRTLPQPQSIQRRRSSPTPRSHRFLLSNPNFVSRLKDATS